MIGKMFYQHDENKRTYTDPITNQRFFSPIYRYSFRTWYIVGETSRSWLLGRFPETSIKNCIKFAKNKNFFENKYLTEEQMEDDIYRHDNRIEISDRVRDLKNVDKMKRIVKILEEL